jgi:hypothetical protein
VSCPLFTRKRTFTGASGMSALPRLQMVAVRIPESAKGESNDPAVLRSRSIRIFRRDRSTARRQALKCRGLHRPRRRRNIDRRTDLLEKRGVVEKYRRHGGVSELAHDFFSETVDLARASNRDQRNIARLAWFETHGGPCWNI